MSNKHRPYLTEEAIMWIYNKSLECKESDIDAATVFKEVAPLAIKIDIGVVKGSYTTTERKDLFTKLGGSIEEFTDPMIAKISNHAKYMTLPATCSKEEVLDALEYKEYTLKEELTEEERAIIDESWGM